MTKPTEESPADSSKNSQKEAPATKAEPNADTTANDSAKKTERPREHGGAKGLEPTRYGDWERNGRCTDF